MDSSRSVIDAVSSVMWPVLSAIECPIELLTFFYIQNSTYCASES